MAAQQQKLFEDIDPALLKGPLLKAVRARLRKVWTEHYGCFHDQYTLDQFLQHPEMGQVLRCHARIDRVVKAELEARKAKA